jgi:hypothetical protein
LTRYQRGIVPPMSISGRRPAALPIAAVLAMIGLGVLVQPATVLAQTNLTATASAGIGVTDNAGSASTGTAGADWGALWLASAGLDGSWAGQKESHDLRYSFGITRSFTGTGRDRQTHALSWNGHYSSDGIVIFSGAASASVTRLDAINIPAMNMTAMPGAIPSAATFFTSTAHAAAAWQPTPLLAWTETTTAHMAVPLDGAQARSTYGVDEAIANDRTFGRDSFIANAQVGYLVGAELKDSLGNVVVPESQSVHGRIMAGWHRSLTPFTDVNASFGGLAAMDPAGGPIVLGPAWRAGLTYHPELGTFSAEIDRTPAPSLYVGRVSVSDRLVVTLGLPIDRAARFHAVGSGGYSHVRFLDASNHLVPGSDVLMVNAGLTFQPLLWPVSFGLHYTRLQQFAYSVSGAPPLPDIERQVLMFAVSGSWSRYPAGAAAGAAGAAPEGM